VMKSWWLLLSLGALIGAVMLNSLLLAFLCGVWVVFAHPEGKR